MVRTSRPGICCTACFELRPHVALCGACVLVVQPPDTSAALARLRGEITPPHNEEGDWVLHAAKHQSGHCAPPPSLLLVLACSVCVSLSVGVLRTALNEPGTLPFAFRHLLGCCLGCFAAELSVSPTGPSPQRCILLSVASFCTSVDAAAARRGLKAMRCLLVKGLRGRRWRQPLCMAADSTKALCRPHSLSTAFQLCTGQRAACLRVASGWDTSSFSQAVYGLRTGASWPQPLVVYVVCPHCVCSWAEVPGLPSQLATVGGLPVL